MSKYEMGRKRGLLAVRALSGERGGGDQSLQGHAVVGYKKMRPKIHQTTMTSHVKQKFEAFLYCPHVGGQVDI